MKTRDELILDFNFLREDLNFPDAIDKRRRGREFEKLINNLLLHENLEPRTSYRPSGEEIDGSFVFSGRVFLLEAKWHKSEMPASSIYQFKGKVDGKLIGTIGIFISISGFSSEAVDALTFGKSINILLFDSSDFEIALSKVDGFKYVLSQKIRRATEEGQAFFPIKSTSISAITKRKTRSDTVEIIENRDFEINNIIFIVESNTDQQIVTEFAERIFERRGVVKDIKVIVAGGKYSVARMANAVRDFSKNNEKIVIVIDSDYDSEQTKQILNSSLDNPEDFITIIPDPQIEQWLSKNIKSSDELAFVSRTLKKRKSEYVSEMIDRVELDWLRTNDEEFAKLYEILS